MNIETIRYGHNQFKLKIWNTLFGNLSGAYTGSNVIKFQDRKSYQHDHREVQQGKTLTTTIYI